MKELDLDENTRKLIVKILINITIQSTCYVVCSRNKDFLDPELFTSYDRFQIIRLHIRFFLSFPYATGHMLVTASFVEMYILF